MDSERTQESTQRNSSVVSSEASSQISLSSGYDYEIVEVYNDDVKASVLKPKSLSLSCLPDHIPDFDHNCLTLPPDLSAVKPFEQNLLHEGASSTASWYKTAECIELSADESEKNSNGEQRQRSAFELDNSVSDGSRSASDVSDLSNEFEAKQGESKTDTFTRTYVRSSALNILAQFPRTETISTMENRAKSSTPDSVMEDGQGGRDESGDQPPTCSKSLDQLSGNRHSRQDEVTTWSSTNNVETKRKKRGLFSDKKKVKEISSTESKSTKLSNDSEHHKKEKKQLGKEKNSTQSSAWFNIFRGKNSVSDERPKESKSKKQRKAIQKSQSFNSNPLPRGSQLNRIDSFRKILRKRQRNPGVVAQGKAMDNMKCMEISSPILKTDFKSRNLVDREVFLRERAYQLDKTTLKRETKAEASNVKTRKDDPSSHTGKDNDNDSCNDEGVTTNGFDDSKESPVPPVRHKHLERKQRLSMHMSGEDALQEDCSKHSKETNDADVDNAKDGRELKDDMSKTINDKKDTEVASEVLCNGHADNPGNDTDVEETQVDENNSQDEATHNTVTFEHPGTDELDDNKTIECGVVGVGSHPSGDMTSPLKSPGGTSSQIEDEFEEVFFDDVTDEKISLRSATVLDDEAAVVSEKDCPDGARMPSERWMSRSDVTTNDSKQAINAAIKRQPNSFSGVPGTTRGNMATSPVGPRTPAVTARRTSSTFRFPPGRPEVLDPIALITDMVPVTFPNFLADRRSQIVLELFTTERTYVRGLETMTELFKKQMLACRIDERDVDAVFSNMDDICGVNRDLLFLLWEKVRHWTNEQCIAQIFIDMEDRFKSYATYCKNFDRADTTLKQMKKNRDFERFLRLCYQNPLCQPGLDLQAYLITVVQRIPRYILFLKSLYKKTPSSHPDYNVLHTAWIRMNKVAEYINSQLEVVQGERAMQELRSTVIGLKAYEVRGRTLLKEGEVCLMSPKKSYKCLLFNDIMVFAVQGTRDRSEIELTLELKTLWFEDLKTQDPQTSKCDAIELYTPHRPYTLYACSRTDKRIWLQKLRTAIVTLLYGPDCDDPDLMDISKRKASDTYFDGSVYCGEYVNAKRHGSGVMAWPNRTRYEGTWADDERHGQGQLTYYTGEKYVGGWVADQKEGEGRMTYVNKDVYHGQWRQGKMHGKGVIEFANGDRYDGEMCHNEVEGKGEMTCISGLIYKGEWKNSKRHGEGHLFLPNGNEYKGEMLNDRICGCGVMIYFNDSKYSGEFVNELRHGSGVLKLVNGTVYDGQWNHDFMNGQGKMAYPNGDEYTGTWYQNKRVGKGQLIFVHGDTYNGEWQGDKMHGKGVMYYKDGSVYEGEWENGEPSGHGKTVYKDKRIYEGEYFKGFCHGRGQLIYPNNVLYVGEWKWDKFDGNGVFNDPNTDYSYTGDWCCGMRDGSGIEISYRTRYEGSWKADMKHGLGEEKSHAGHVFKGTWKENRKHGEGTRTLIRSKVEEVQHWHEGHLIDSGETVAEGLPPLPRR